MSSTPASAAEGFTFFSNRGSRIFERALSPLGGSAWVENNPPPDLLYFDSYGGKQAPTSEARFSLIDRQRTIPLDHKAQMTAALLAAGRSFPRVYFELEQVPHEPGSLWFIKNPTSTAGKGTEVVQFEELGDHYRDNCIIEEAIQDVSLIDDRKFTLRLYLLVLAGKLYFYPDAIVFLHGLPYVHGSCDPQVQFIHDGYMDPDSPVTSLTSDDYPDYPDVRERLAQLALETFRVFADLLKHEPPDRYCLFGIDALVRSDHSGVIVEINDRPNIVHTRNVNEGVNIPMIRAMYCILDPRAGSSMEERSTRFRLLGEL